MVPRQRNDRSSLQYHNIANAMAGDYVVVLEASSLVNMALSDAKEVVILRLNTLCMCIHRCISECLRFQMETRLTDTDISGLFPSVRGRRATLNSKVRTETMKEVQSLLSCGLQADDNSSRSLLTTFCLAGNKWVSKGWVGLR